LTRPGAPGRRGFAFRHCRGRHRAHGRQHQSHQHHQQRIPVSLRWSGHSVRYWTPAGRSGTGVSRR